MKAIPHQGKTKPLTEMAAPIPNAGGTTAASSHCQEPTTLKAAAALFAGGYAKRVMDGQYTRLMQTKLGKRTLELSRPSKYAVEMVLNGIVAYLGTKVAANANTPVEEFLWEIAKDAPSEISKRLMHGEQATSAGAMIVEPSAKDQQAALDGLLRMDIDDLRILISLLENASPQVRREMAEAMSTLSETEQKRSHVWPSDKSGTLSASSAASTVPKQAKRSTKIEADLDAAHKRVDEELRRLRERGKA